MKIRITGIKAEIEQAEKYYRELEKQDHIKSVVISKPYINRGSSTVYRLYVDIEYYDAFLLKGGNYGKTD